MVKKQKYQDAIYKRCTHCNKLFTSLYEAQLEAWIATHMRYRHPIKEQLKA